MISDSQRIARGIGESAARSGQAAFPRSGLPGYPRREMLVFLAFLAFVVVRYIQIGVRMDILRTIRFEFLVGIIVILLVTLQWLMRPPELKRAIPILVMIGLLFVMMIFQLPFAAAPEIARRIFNDRVIKFAFLTYFMMVMIESPNGLKLFIAAFLFSVFYVTLESVQGLISGGLVWQNQGIMRLHGAVPIYQHPNSLAGVAVGAIPFIVFLFSHVRSWILKLWLLGAAGTSIICMIYSGSRTAYIGIIVFVLWWWFQSEKKGKFLKWLVIGATVTVMVLPDQYVERFKSIGGEEAEGGSKAARIQILEDAWTIFLDNPLGVGIASFPTVRYYRFGRYQDTHNLYLEVATNLGIQGFVVFVVLLVVMLGSFRRSMMSFRAQKKLMVPILKDRELESRFRSKVLRHYREMGFLEATCKAAGGFIILRLALGVFGMDLYEVYWWFGAGLAISLAGIAVHAEKRTIALGVIRERARRATGNHRGG